VYYPATSQVAIATAGTQAMLANASQGVQFANAIGVGATTPSTSGAGITFPATQSASSDANTLDDYEEGSFSGVFLIGSTAQPVGQYQVCKYIKVGKLVHISGIASIGTKTGATGNVYLSGLPFTVDATTDYYGGGCFGIYSNFTIPSGTTILGEVQRNSNQILLFYGTGSGVSIVTQTVAGNNSYLEFGFNYVASA
jgi:hypothetical protein